MKPGGALSPLKDKRVQLAAAGAGVLGLVVLLKRGGGDPAGASIQPAATLDSSGTDLANALQSFGDQLSDIRDQLPQQPSSGTGADPGAGTPKPPAPKPKPPAPKPKPPAPKPSALFATITKWGGSGPKWTQSLSGVASHYHTSVGSLLKLNPSIKNPNLVRTGQKIRYR